MMGMAGVNGCANAHRGLLPARRACAGRHPPEAAPDFTSVSHAEDSTIGSNFCQGPVGKKMQNEECKMQNEEAGAGNGGF